MASTGAGSGIGNPLSIIQKGESLNFVFDRDGEDVDGWVCVLTVKKFQSSTAEIERTIELDNNDQWSGFLTRIETAALISSGIYRMIGTLTNTSTNEKETIPVRFKVSRKQWASGEVAFPPVLCDNDPPEFSQVIFLAGFNGVDLQTTFTEESPNAAVATFQSVTSLSDLEVKFGSTSLSVRGGISAVAQFPDISAYTWQLNQDRTVRFWYQREGTGGTIRETIIGQYDSSGNQRSWYIAIDEAQGNIVFGVTPDGTTIVDFVVGDAPGYLDTNWHEIALTYRAEDNLYTIYFDGKAIVQKELIMVPFDTSAVLQFGNRSDGIVSQFNGWVDEVRITDFLDITCDYPVRTQEFPRS